MTNKELIKEVEETDPEIIPYLRKLIIGRLERLDTLEHGLKLTGKDLEHTIGITHRSDEEGFFAYKIPLPRLAASGPWAKKGEDRYLELSLRRHNRAVDGTDGLTSNIETSLRYVFGKEPHQWYELARFHYEDDRHESKVLIDDPGDGGTVAALFEEISGQPEKKKKYRVVVEAEMSYSCDVDAPNQEEAERRAKDIWEQEALEGFWLVLGKPNVAEDGLHLPSFTTQSWDSRPKINNSHEVQD